MLAEEGLMDRLIGRRSFLKESAVWGAASAAGLAAAAKNGFALMPPAGKTTVIAVGTGTDYGKTAVKAVELLGGMDKFVAKGASVAVLANSQGRHPGTFTSPAVLQAVIRMCREAGASRVDCVSWLNEKNWNDSGLAKAIADAGASLVLVPRTDENFQKVPVPKGKALTEAQVMKEILRHDVFIDMPITKDHAGMKFTGTLKNLMGINSPASNRGFHKDNWETDPTALAHLDQSIADLNTVVAPALCVVDATEFIVTNGPFGPGELRKPQKVVAGTDRVAVDTYCASLWGLKGAEIGTLRFAREHGLGEIDLAKVKIREAKA
jgi:uncharacterized protein (DUF362 family)